MSPPYVNTSAYAPKYPRLGRCPFHEFIKTAAGETAHCHCEKQGVYFPLCRDLYSLVQFSM